MLKQRRPYLYKGVLIIIACMLIGTFPPSSITDASSDSDTMAAPPVITAKDYINGTIPTYLEWLATTAKSYANAPAHQERIEVSGSKVAASSDQQHFQASENGLVWSEGDSWVEYSVTVPEDGLYNIGLAYDTVDEGSVDLVRGIQIDGATPFIEAENIILKRKFTHSNFPLKRDEFTNDILPHSIDTKGLREVSLTDYTADSEPLRWYLSKGSHTVRLINEQGAMLLKTLYVDAPRELPSYGEWVKTEPANKESVSSESKPYLQIVEAENITAKSNTSIQLQSTNDALVQPDSQGYIRYNTLGGEQFKTAGQWVEWQIEVPQDGAYQIGFKYKQAFLNQSNAFESITIDGLTPFKELLHVAFPYNSSWNWEGKTLGDGEGKPYSFYLTKGKHNIRMTASSSPIKPIYEGLLRNINRISALDQQIRKITGNYEKSYTTGGNVDPNRDWQLEKYIPDLKQQLTNIEQDLLSLADRLSKITVGKSDVEISFRATASDFADMQNKIRNIPNQMQLFEVDQQQLSGWAFRLLDQPLLLDYLWVAQPDAKLPKMKTGFIQKTKSTLINFYHSFTIDYNFTRKDPKAIDVWVNRGRNYVRLIQQLADENFTPVTGIHVNVNIIPDANLLILSNLAGKEPDAALGLDGATVVDFASRDALVDLSQYPDYAEAAKAFKPGALRVFHYDKKDYALPETQNFKIMMYRTDILDQLGLKAPNTWEDVYNMMPTLQQSGYDFYMPSDFLPFLYQNGGEMYTKDGLTSALDTNEAYKGFLQWTQLYTLFQVPKEVPSFFNHFRLGDIPIGITDFNTYLQTQVAAPEIAGKWKIAPIPGNHDDKGVVERWAGGALQAGVIYNKSNKQELAWQFLKWWTSEETQTRFGNDIEGIYGREYRWNTANQDAFVKLPWPRADLKAITDQWLWYKEAPQVPGGYFTMRNITFAWQNVVTGSKVPREELEIAVQNINREMARKQVEFQLRDQLGNVQHSLDIVSVPNPAKGEGP
ncbi:ABC transporter substrate-binding protein [Paenibacillus baekrokdamisoli]|uniref:ABC transporter substrate-binding protein n=1 Tax=Paenibacillus baekrokdamisoli TaxID=1712516 RepID=A0A3G9JAL6_9BACL|nr:extracellular solute-binding protein [Paenibacillus baekrokdamisoli]MBB3072022.1 ABC-type glycerol-3-phosphate transport system substrate-binding protein [Paenibacillus baekrokdamisoli]BBH20324.1 ABC transporter substrate-binding protein [Paenibacillus baekrokdamisoli]